MGKNAGGVAAGGCVGTAFTLDIGQKVKRERPLTNRNLSEEQRLFNSLFSLYVQDSAWKLGIDGEDGVQIITDSNDEYSPNGPIVQGLESLVGISVHYARFDPQTYDLDLFFRDDSKRLRIFGSTPARSSGYSLFLPEYVVSVEGDELEVERR